MAPGSHPQNIAAGLSQDERDVLKAMASSRDHSALVPILTSSFPTTYTAGIKAIAPHLTEERIGVALRKLQAANLLTPGELFASVSPSAPMGMDLWLTKLGQGVAPFC